MRQTNDGFIIAEEDLKIRGAGEIIGKKQSGMPSFRNASFAEHYDLFKIAAQDSKLIIKNDKHLVSERGQALRQLLKIYNYKSDILYKI